MLKELAAYLRGWKSYFGFCQTPWILRNLDYWIRRRLRSMIWKQWKRGAVRFRELRRRDVSVDLAAKTAGSAHGPWRLAWQGRAGDRSPYADFGGWQPFCGRQAPPPLQGVTDCCIVPVWERVFTLQKRELRSRTPKEELPARMLSRG
jgi:hypothetical protein